MLPLDSPRWSELDVFFETADQVPQLIDEWTAAIGFDQEREIYNRLFQFFLHQNTTTNIAYAIVPWIVKHCTKAELINRAEYVGDVATVEQRRLTTGVKFVREGGEPEPDWLMDDYKGSIVAAQQLAEDLLEEELPQELRSHLWQVQPALHGNVELLKKRQNW